MKTEVTIIFDSLKLLKILILHKKTHSVLFASPHCYLCSAAIASTFPVPSANLDYQPQLQLLSFAAPSLTQFCFSPLTS